MTHITRRVAVALLLVTAALTAACVDGSVVDPITPPLPGGFPPPPEEQLDVAISAATTASDVALGTCTNLAAPSGQNLTLRVFATGDQIYRWNGTGWDFVAPSAVLYSATQDRGFFGTHYAGPTWESRSGSKAVAAVLDRCTPDPSAIPWLLLKVTAAYGSGPMSTVEYIQRVQTVGGLAPDTPGAVTGQEARVPYTTEYLFYRSGD
jgi:hypothetical protein